MLAYLYIRAFTRPKEMEFYVCFMLALQRLSYVFERITVRTIAVLHMRLFTRDSTIP